MLLVDTSAWIDYFKSTGDPAVRKHVARLLSQDKVGWCEMIFLELQGSPNSKQSAAISVLKPILPMYSITTDCWSYAYELARISKKAGKPVPNTDALIYATASVYGQKLVHNDKHFDWLDEITGRDTAKR